MNNQIATKDVRKSAYPFPFTIDRNAHFTIPINPNLVWDYDIPPERERRFAALVHCERASER